MELKSNWDCDHRVRFCSFILSSFMKACLFIQDGGKHAPSVSRRDMRRRCIKYHIPKIPVSVFLDWCETETHFVSPPSFKRSKRMVRRGAEKKKSGVFKNKKSDAWVVTDVWAVSTCHEPFAASRSPLLVRDPSPLPKAITIVSRIIRPNVVSTSNRLWDPVSLLSDVC